MGPQFDLTSKVAIKASSIRPQAATTDLNGAAVDCNLADAFQAQCIGTAHFGAVSGTNPTYAVKIQESDDSSTWVDITGATFAAAAANTSSTIRFLRSRRYVRAVGTIGGTSTPTINVCVEICQPLKLQG